MAALYLTEDDVRNLVDMDSSINVVERAFYQLSEGGAKNIPRARAKASGIMLHTMSAAAEYLGVVGWKAYTTTRQGARFHVALYDNESGEMLALIEADYLGQLRTGAASGVAATSMARIDSSVVGVFGSGKQARTQLEAVCTVRNIDRAEVYSPSEDHRTRFAEEMSEQLQIEVAPVPLPELVAEEKDIIICATSSKTPLFDGRAIDQGTHLNVIGSNFLLKAEVDDVTVRQADKIVCDSTEQCKIEAGDFVAALEEGAIEWSFIQELGDVVAGKETGRSRSEDITLFKSVGLAIQDVALAAEILDRARQKNLGQPLPF